MKRCPKCDVTYADETLNFCLEDGEWLQSDSEGEPATAILHSTDASRDAQTRKQIFDTDQTSVLSGTSRGNGELPGNSNSEIPVASPQNHKLLIASGIAILILATAGFGYWYFKVRTFSTKSSSISSIAVLPFQNKSDDADTDYLSDGIAESLVFRLSQLPGLKVSPTSSVMRYKGKEMEVGKIASELGVDAVMTGRLMKRGDSLNITVELVDVRNNKTLWGEQYERKMSDLLAVQREIATTITEKLQLRLAGDEAKGITKKYTDSNEAYQLYLRGRYSFAKRTKPDMLAAIEYFEQAIKLDPKFALAYARISETYGSMPAYPYLSPNEAFPKAKAAAEKALEIDPTLSEAHTFLAYSLAIYDWNWPAAERAFKRAIELDPNNSTAHFRYGQIYLLATGHFEEGIAEIKRGLELEPLDVNMGATLASAYMYNGQNAANFEQAKKTYDLESNHPIARWMMSQAYTQNGKFAESIALNEEWLKADPRNQFALREAGIAYAKAGRRDKADEMISKFQEIGKSQYVPACRLASIYAALGEKDRAFEELNKAFEARDWELYRMNADQYFASLRDDPRFDGMVKRLNLPE